jgi:dynein heavy chain
VSAASRASLPSLRQANQAKGKTVLYIPSENVADARAAAKDKDLVQRLETTVIHWTRQIKEVVNAQDHVTHSADSSGPLDEIEFWRRRTVDLSGISEQLQLDGVRNIVAVLEAAKSSYLGPFDVLAKLIQRGSEEANDNLKFLNTLTDSCMQLTSSEPKVRRRERCPPCSCLCWLCRVH